MEVRSAFITKDGSLAFVVDAGTVFFCNCMQGEVAKAVCDAVNSGQDCPGKIKKVDIHLPTG